MIIIFLMKTIQIHLSGYKYDLKLNHLLIIINISSTDMEKEITDTGGNNELDQETVSSVIKVVPKNNLVKNNNQI